MEKVIKELEAKKNMAFEHSKDGNSYYAGAYKAYHSAIELIKRAEKDKNKVVV